jgi:hypothetical protein
MEMSQGNSLRSYLKQTKNAFFKNWKKARQNRSCLGGGEGTSGKEEDIRKGYREWNVVEILCSHV